MIINHNMASLNTYNKLNTNTTNTAKSLEKLSSGLRINKAGDDAAGLAISEKMRSQIRGLDQAGRNSQDAISMIQTAEGSLSETHSILQRMRELAVQSANGTNTTDDRNEIQKEVNQLTSEINRIGNTTEFNNKKLLNGDYAFKAATAGKTTGTSALNATTVISDLATAGSVTGDTYGAAGQTATQSTAGSVTGNAVLKGSKFTYEVTDTVTGLAASGDKYEIQLQGQDGNMVTVTLSGTSGANSTSAFNISGTTTGMQAADIAGALSLAIAASGNLAGRYEVGVTGSSITIKATDSGAGYEIKQSAETQIGAATFAVTNGAPPTVPAGDSQIKIGENNELTLKVDDGAGNMVNRTITMDAAFGTDDILKKLNTALENNNVNAVATINNDRQLVISSKTSASNSKVEIVGGGFADSFLMAKSSNGTMLTTAASVSGVAADKISVTLQGADGTNVDVVLSAADDTSGSNSATTFKVGNGSTDSQAANIREALAKAIAANSNLAGRYVVTDDGTGAANSAINITAGKAGSGYAISEFTYTQTPGASTVVGTKGYASNVSDTVTVQGKDQGDVKVHADTSASVTSSMILTDTVLATSGGNVQIEAGVNNELTINVDGTEKTVALADKNYDGTVGTAAANSAMVNTKAVSGSTIAVTLMNDAGVDVTLTLSGGSGAANSATVFECSGSVEDNANNIATALNLAIANDATLSGKYTAASDGNGKVTITANVAGSDSEVSDFTAGGTAGLAFSGEVTTEGAGGRSSIHQAELSGIASGDSLSTTLRGRDGELYEIKLTAIGSGQNSSTEFVSGATNAASIANLASAFNKAVASNEQLRGLYTADASANMLSIKSDIASSDYSVNNFTQSGISVSGESNIAGRNAQNTDGLIRDVSSAVNEVYKSSVTDTVTGVAAAADKYEIQLQGKDGEMVTVSLIGSGVANTKDNFDTTTATTSGNASNIAAALQLAIDANTNLAGRYTASASGDTLTIKAYQAGDGYAINQSSETASTTFAVTNGAASDSQIKVDVSVDSNNKLKIAPANTSATSSLQVTGGGLADTILGTVGTRVSEDRQAANDTLSFNVDGAAKSVTVAQQTYQDLNEFISVNKDAFTAAGVTASNNGGKLKLTSITTGTSSAVTGVADSDLAKQLGLEKADGTALDAANFMQGGIGNQKLDFKLDGGTTTYTAELQKGDYTDKNVLAAAVQSAMNKAIIDAGDTGSVTASIADGKLMITSDALSANSKVEFAANAEADARGSLNLVGATVENGTDQTAAELTFQIGANNGQSMGLAISDMRSVAIGISSKTENTAAGFGSKDVTNGSNSTAVEYGLNVADPTEAGKAIDIISAAITKVSAERSKMGASQNRLEHTIANLSTSSENLTSAESRIRDVDMAKEMMQFQKNNILAQAATAMLAQANQQPQGVLQLLR